MGTTSGGKAFFSGEAGQFTVQYNPKELKLEDTASWKPSDEQGQDRPLLTYEKGEPAVLSFDLIFDSTVENVSVQGAVDRLRSFLTASQSEEDSGGQSKRPPHVTFNWGGFSFDGVVEKVSASMLMFRPDGTPLRAKVSVTMKERSIEGGPSSSFGGFGGMLSTAAAMVASGGGATVATVVANQTLNQIAAANNTDMRSIAAANPNITDPTNIPAGSNVVIPANAQFANAMADQALGQAPINTSPVNNIGAFSGGNAGNALGNLGNLAGGNDDSDLSAAFVSSGLGGAVDNVADRARELTDRAHAEVHEAINDVQARAHDVLGMPDFF